MTVRSLPQQEQSARTLIQNALAQGKSDDEAIAYAIAALGADSDKLVRRVWQKWFAIMGPI
jgi:uncharacterized protein YoaH (UPF0181 family)